jgi:hypothetical protein
VLVQVAGDQVRYFLLGRLRAGFGDENLVRHLRVKPAFFLDIGRIMRVDLDPAVEIDRFQADGEGF